MSSLTSRCGRARRPMNMHYLIFDYFLICNLQEYWYFMLLSRSRSGYFQDLDPQSSLFKLGAAWMHITESFSAPK